MSKYQDLERLGNLRNEGNIDEHEYEQEKQRILKRPDSANVDFGMDPHIYATLLHLSTFLFPFFGPLVMWLVAKDKNDFIDDHGKEAVNFHISYMIYFIASGILMLIFIGIFTMIAFAVLQVIFIILAAINASKGEIYRIPFIFRLIK